MDSKIKMYLTQNTNGVQILIRDLNQTLLSTAPHPPLSPPTDTSIDIINIMFLNPFQDKKSNDGSILQKNKRSCPI